MRLRTAYRLKGAQVGEQLLGMIESLRIGWLEPAEFAKIFHPGGLQSEHYFREVQSSDLRDLLNRAMPVFFLRPETEAVARRRSPRAAGPLVRRGLANLL